MAKHLRESDDVVRALIPRSRRRILESDEGSSVKEVPIVKFSPFSHTRRGAKIVPKLVAALGSDAEFNVSIVKGHTLMNYDVAEPGLQKTMVNTFAVAGVSHHIAPRFTQRPEKKPAYIDSEKNAVDMVKLIGGLPVLAPFVHYTLLVQELKPMRNEPTYSMPLLSLVGVLDIDIEENVAEGALSFQRLAAAIAESHLGKKQEPMRIDHPLEFSRAVDNVRRALGRKKRGTIVKDSGDIATTGKTAKAIEIVEEARFILHILRTTPWNVVTGWGMQISYPIAAPLTFQVTSERWKDIENDIAAVVPGKDVSEDAIRKMLRWVIPPEIASTNVMVEAPFRTVEALIVAWHTYHCKREKSVKRGCKAYGAALQHVIDAAQTFENMVGEINARMWKMTYNHAKNEWENVKEQRSKGYLFFEITDVNETLPKDMFVQCGEKWMHRLDWDRMNSVISALKDFQSEQEHVSYGDGTGSELVKHVQRAPVTFVETYGGAQALAEMEFPDDFVVWPPSREWALLARARGMKNIVDFYHQDAAVFSWTTIAATRAMGVSPFEISRSCITRWDAALQRAVGIVIVGAHDLSPLGLEQCLRMVLKMAPNVRRLVFIGDPRIRACRPPLQWFCHPIDAQVGNILGAVAEKGQWSYPWRKEAAPPVAIDGLPANIVTVGFSVFMRDTVIAYVRKMNARKACEAKMLDGIVPFCIVYAGGSAMLRKEIAYEFGRYGLRVTEDPYVKKGDQVVVAADLEVGQHMNAWITHPLQARGTVGRIESVYKLDEATYQRTAVDRVAQNSYTKRTRFFYRFEGDEPGIDRPFLTMPVNSATLQSLDSFNLLSVDNAVLFLRWKGVENMKRPLEHDKVYRLLAAVNKELLVVVDDRDVKE